MHLVETVLSSTGTFVSLDSGSLAPTIVADYSVRIFVDSTTYLGGPFVPSSGPTTGACGDDPMAAPGRELARVDRIWWSGSFLYVVPMAVPNVVPGTLVGEGSFPPDAGRIVPAVTTRVAPRVDPRPALGCPAGARTDGPEAGPGNTTVPIRVADVATTEIRATIIPVLVRLLSVWGLHRFVGDSLSY